jgi:hypothetical protein
MEAFFGAAAPEHLLAALEHHLAVVLPGRERDLVARIDTASGPIAAGGSDLLPGAGHALLPLAAVLVAAYRVLLPELDDPERTVALLAHVARGASRSDSRLATRLICRRHGDALDAVERHLRDAAPRLGSAWQVEYERTRGAFELRVTACGFHAFMAQHGVPELTRACCAWDASWIDAIDPGRDGMVAERVTTLATGGVACPFRYRARSARVP